ncbi:CHAT domain-containing protein [Streptomyces sp. NPDC051132]|uniref:CHAT domain-containing protein n=1 Tax=unclassified Streptomyces TaxID=2593676 RepID=UPI0034273EF8
MMMARSSPPNWTDRIADPGVALSFPPATASHPERDIRLVEDRDRADAAALFDASDWAALGDRYDLIAERAWKAGCRAETLRLLLAARTAARLAGDTGAVLERTRFLAERHRLSTSFLAAQSWNRAQLRMPLTSGSAVYHVTAWRALAELCEPSGAYDSAVVLSDRALAVADDFAGAPGVARARAQALLQRGNTERLRGDIEAAYAFLRDARAQAGELAAEDASPHLRGLIARVHARTDIIVGHYDSALAMYLEAEERFRESGSSVNVRVVRLARVAALRALRRFPEALLLCRELLRECAEPGRERMRGQVLLEQAEVLEAMGDGAGADEALEQARRHHEGARTLEAARWHRHMGRRLIMSDGDMGRAAAHLTASLGIAVRDVGPDLTRTWLTLHDLLRLRGDAALGEDLALLVSRTALAGADLQRDRLTLPENRWALQEQREEVYAGALMVHGTARRHEDVARIIELGRSDVLDHVLENPPADAHQPLATLPMTLPGGDPGRAGEVFRTARAVRAALAGEEGPPLGPGAPALPGRLPSAAGTEALAEVVVLVHVGKGADGWWSSVASRVRHGAWRSSRQSAPAALDGLLDTLAAGEPLPEYGVSDHTWELLGRFLLPHDTAWSGTADRPLALLLSPDLRLWQLPYGALRRDGVCLLDVAEVTLTPSLRTHGLLGRAGGGTGGALGADAAPAVSVLDPRLSGHAEEAAALAGWPGSHVELAALDPAEDLTSAALLYLSGLGEAAGETRLGPLRITLGLLASLRLPRLLVLNGCWTGTAASRYGRDPLSLAVGGLLGRAQAVVAGVGHINSWSSAQVGAGLLASVARGGTPGSALRQAQRELRDAYPELGPYDWAGMCLIGRGEEPLFRADGY